MGPEGFKDFKAERALQLGNLSIVPNPQPLNPKPEPIGIGDVGSYRSSRGEGQQALQAHLAQRALVKRVAKLSMLPIASAPQTVEEPTNFRFRCFA